MRIAIFITASNKKEAVRIARKLVGEKLAACVNIVDGVDSYFRWQGKIDHAAEVLLIVKSRKEKLPAIIGAVKSMHSYSVPEIIALPIAGGDKPYLEWLDESIGRSA